MTYDLRRLRLHGFVERIPRTHRYRITKPGLRSALFFTRTYDRILRPGLARLDHDTPDALRSSYLRFETALDRWCDSAHLAYGGP